MITFIATESHRHHIKHVSDAIGKQKLCIKSYDWLRSHSNVPLGTWIFTDCDRLSSWEIEIACRHAIALLNAGATVINDPRAFLPRGSLLKALHQAGINSFLVWRPVEGEWPNRFPVFLRTESAHRGALTELLYDQASVDAELSRLVEEGYPLRDLLAVEYRAEELSTLPGAFCKYAAYIVGDALVGAPSVIEKGWHAKFGTKGLSTDAEFRHDHEQSMSLPHKDTLRRAFELAGVSFGRIDYAIVDGRPEIYEINTNPHIRGLTEHRSAVRMETVAASNRGVVEAMRALDRPAPLGKLDVDLPYPTKTWLDRFRHRHWQP